MASRQSKYNGSSSSTPIKVDVITPKPSHLPEEVSPLLRRNKGTRPAFRKIDLIQLVAQYTLAEGVSIPILTGLYYDIDNPSTPQPLSVYGKSYRIVGIEAGGNVYYEQDNEYEMIITDYEYATSIILKALEALENPPQAVPTPQINTHLFYVLMVLQMLTIAVLLVIHS